MALRLIIEDEEGATTIVPLTEEEITIGREPGNTIQLTEQNVSRQHARLTLGPDGWILEDLDSYNGVKINNVPVEGSVTLMEGDLVQIGDYHLALSDDVERTTLNLDRPSQAANSADPFQIAPSVDLPRLTDKEMADLQVAAQMPGAVYTSEPEEEEKKGGFGLIAGIVIVLLLVAGGAYAVFGGGDEKPKGDTKSKVAKKKDPPAKQGPTKEAASAADASASASASEAASASSPDPSSGEDSGEPAATGGPDDTGAADASSSGDDSGEADTAEADSGEADTAEDDSGAADAAGEDSGEDSGDVVDDTGDEPPPDDPPVTKKKKKLPKKPKPKPKGDPAELLKQAQQASVAGNASKAYKLAKQSYKIDKNAKALQLMGVSACKMGDAGKAKSVYKKVSGSTKKGLKSLCAKKGISLE